MSINGDTGFASSPDLQVVEINDEYKFFTLNAPDASYLGTYTIEVQVDLHDNAWFTGAI